MERGMILSRTMIQVFVTFIFGSFLLSSCSSVPGTGRSSFIIVSDYEMAEMGEYAFTEYKQMFRQSRDPLLTARVQKIGRRLAEVAPTNIHPDDWEIVLFNDDSINAFAMPGGKIGVFKGIFKVAKTDDQLAIVLAHEIAHVTSKHIHEKVSKVIFLETGGQLLGYSVGNRGYQSNVIMQVYSLGASAGVASFSRKHEREADYVGLLFAARAGYDPRQAVDLMMELSMVEAESGADIYSTGMLSTHPTTADRIERIKENLPDAIREYEFATNTYGD